MNEAVEPFFVSPLIWSGEPAAVEEWVWGDGLLALVIGGAVVLACALAAGAITIVYALGRLS